MPSRVGFDRKIDLQWLDALADQTAQTDDKKELRNFSHNMLEPQHSNFDARRKSVTVLLRIWVQVPCEHKKFQREACELLGSIRSDQRIWLHWGMSQLAYPLFRSVAETIGRLLRLQDEFTIGQIERRVFAKWGERSTVRRAVQRIMRSMVEWGVIRDSGAKGVYEKCDGLLRGPEELQLWLLQVCLAAGDGDSMELGQLLNNPILFPFELTVDRSSLRQSSHFDLHRQGLDMDIINLNLD